MRYVTWIPELVSNILFVVVDKEYWKSFRPKLYKITPKTFKEVLLNMRNNDVPGNDKINIFYMKKLSSTLPHLLSQFNGIFESNKPLPQWLVRGKTILLAKNDGTKLLMKYHLIACLNITYKIYISMLNPFY